ncbi:MAG: alpha/beta hydrolase, partial [Ferruginibacter sp.]
MSPTVIYIIIGYVVLLALVYLLQERFIFKPEKLKQNFQYKYDAPFRELFFDVEPGVRINGLHFYVEKPLGLILYFHGNSRS